MRNIYILVVYLGCILTTPRTYIESYKVRWKTIADAKSISEI